MAAIFVKKLIYHGVEMCLVTLSLPFKGRVKTTSYKYQHLCFIVNQDEVCLTGEIQHV